MSCSDAGCPENCSRMINLNYLQNDGETVTLCNSTHSTSKYNTHTQYPSYPSRRPGPILQSLRGAPHPGATYCPTFSDKLKKFSNCDFSHQTFPPRPLIHILNISTNGSNFVKTHLLFHIPC